MAKVGGSGGRGLNFTANLNISEAKRNAAELAKIYKDLKIQASSIAPPVAPSSNLVQTQVQLQNTSRAARQELERLKVEEQQLLNQQARLGVATAESTAKFNANRLAQQELRLALQAARNAQVAATGSYREAQERLKALGKEIRENAGGFANLGRSQQEAIAEYRALNAQLTEFDRRMGNNQRNVGNYQSALNGLVGIASNYVSAYGAIAGISKIVSNNAEISDSLADVRRTAGLTEEEADKLLTTFKGFDTRTSLKGLLDIATIAGQLGIAKADIEGFTRSVDRLSIVLSGEIPGGAEAVATALGKINGVFDTQKQEGTNVEESYNKTGSAILGLGQAGLATGAFLVDFTQRVAGTAKQANISLPVMLAYGSVLEEAGKSAEVAGSSVNKVIASLSVNRPQFFAIARLGDATLTLKQFTNTINTDVNGALQLFFKGLNSGNPSQTAFADRLKTIPRLAGETRSSIIALAQSQVKLSEKIKISNEDYNDASKIADQFALKNDNLAGSLDKLGKVFETASTSGSTGRFFKGIIDYLRISLSEFTKLVNSSSWKEFFTRLVDNNGDAFELRSAFNRVSKQTNADYNALQPGADHTDLENKLQAAGADRMSKSLEKLKKTADDAKDALKKYQDGVKSGAIVEKGATIDDYRIIYNKAEDNYKSLLALQKKFGFDKKKETIKQTTDSGLNTPDKAELAAVSRARTLQGKIDEINKAAKRSTLDKDESEVQSVKDKYDKIRQEVADFYADPKNKGKKVKVDVSALDASEKSETNAALAGQDAKDTLKSFDKQKKLYTDYENYRLAFGKEMAEKRYGDEVNTQATYLQKLEAERDKIQNIAPSQRTGVQKQQLKEVQTRIDAETEAEQAKYTALLTDLRSYQDKATALDDSYAAKKKAILDKEATEGPEKTALNIKLLGEEYAADTDNLKDSVLQKSEAYKHLTEQVTMYTKQQLKAQIEAIEYTLKNATEMSPKLRESLAKELGEVKVRLSLGGGYKAFEDDLKKRKKEIELSISTGLQVDDKGNLTTIKLTTEQIKEQTKALAENNEQLKLTSAQKFDKLSRDLAEIGGAFDDLSGIIDESNAGLKDTFTALGEIAKVGSDASGSIASFMSGDVIGGITKGIKALTGAISFFTRGKASAKAAAIELQGHQDDLFKSEIVYNELLRERARTLKDIGALSIAELNTQKSLLATQTTAAQNDYNKLLAKIQASGQQITGYHNEKYGGFLGIGKKTRTVADTAGLAGVDYDTLEKLFTEGNLDEATKSWFTELQKAKSELDAIGVSTDDVLAAINQAATGTTSASIADAIISGFKQGKKTAADFADDFKGLMEDAALSAFKSNYLNAAIADFYKQFASASADGLSDEDVKTLRDAYSKIIQDSADQLAGFDKVIGGIGTTKDPSAIQGTITASGLTEDTGNELKGIFRGTYDQTKLGVKTMGDIYQMSVKQFNTTLEIAANTKRGADNTDGIGGKLDKIIANTSSGNAGDPFRNAGINLG